MTGAAWLSGLHLSHFRSHLDLRLALDARPVAVFGANGAGKTNLVEAVSMLAPGRGLRRAATEDLARKPERIGWKVTARARGGTVSHEVVTYSDGPRRRVVIDGKSAPQTSLAGVLRVLWLTPEMDRLWQDGASERRRFLDRMAMSLVPDHGEAVLGYERAMRERNRLLQDQVRDAAWYGALEAQMASFGEQVTGNRMAALDALGAAQDGGESGFPKARLTLQGAAPGRADALSAALRAGRRADLAAGRSLTGPHRDDLVAVYAAKDMPARLCSTGEQKALLISVILANARAVATAIGAPPILVLDEVAAHLDAERRVVLYDEIAALRAQAWMTGTGQELFEALGTRAQYLRVREHDGVSVVDGE